VQFLGLPKFCINFHGPHSLECLSAMWFKVGCVEEGDNFPPKLNFIQIDFLNRKPLP